MSQAHVSIGGNNGVIDNTIEYIFAKREYEIALLLAYRLYKYYVIDDVQ
ncbi:hypothetical protein GW750_01760 [bacterium]|nr:hypothetical protein [bacterium]